MSDQPADESYFENLGRFSDSTQKCVVPNEVRSTDSDSVKNLEPPKASNESKSHKGQRDLLLEIANRAELWHDADKKAYATIAEGLIRENVKVRSPHFKNWLSYKLYQARLGVANSQAMEDALKNVEAKALYDGEEHDPKTRVAGDGQVSYVHLADSVNTTIRIDSSGWAPQAGEQYYRFVTSKGMLPLPLPQKIGNLEQARRIIEQLREYCNVPDDDEWLLFIATLLSAFRPKGPYVVLFIVGEQGSAKSTLARVFRRLIDPSKNPLRSQPKDERDLWVATKNGWIVAFDNVSRISSELSDLICRVATGGGNSYRTLYENDEETIFEAQRLVVITAIDDLALRNDLADRTVRINCPRIRDENRRLEEDFWTEFDRNESLFLGALFTLLSQALAVLPNVRRASWPRMADFAKFGVSVERALGLEQGRFLAAYQNDRTQASEALLDEPFARLILDLTLPIREQPTDLLKLLKAKYSGSDKSPAWLPSSASHLSSRLRRLSPALGSRGIAVNFGKSGPRYIEIERLESLTSLSSSPPKEAYKTPSSMDDLRTASAE